MRLVIQTNRLILRLPVAADAPAIARQIGVWEVASMLSKVPWPYVPSMAEDWLHMQEQSRRAGRSVSFMIAPADAPEEVLGNVSLNDRREGDAELGYWLGVDHWGQGIMSEAARAAVAFGFDVWGLETMSSGHFDDNRNSGRVLAKLGFTKTGSGPIPCAARNNAAVPHTYLALEAAEWWRGPGSATSL
ncbi:MAG: GNAT family N-acetyltransferase [Alphaproteobacteria bacterium]